MAGELVQHIAANESTTSTSISFSFGSNITAGNTIVLVAAFETTTGSLVFTDNVNGTSYNNAVTLQDTGTINSTLTISVALGCRAGATTITVTGPSCAYREVHLMEFTAASTGGGVDQVAGAVGNSASPSSGAKTTVLNGEVIVGYGAFGGTPTAGTGFTQADLISGDMSEWQVQTSAGSIAAAYTQSPSSAWGVVMATLHGPQAAKKLGALGVG